MVTSEPKGEINSVSQVECGDVLGAEGQTQHFLWRRRGRRPGQRAPLLGFLFLYLGYISFPNTLRMFDPGHHTRVLIAAAAF